MFIFCSVTLDILALGLVTPVLPDIVLGFMGGDTARAAEVYGVFGTAWALMQFLAMPVLGALSDRYGRRPVILFSCLGLGLDHVLMALAPSLATARPEPPARSPAGPRGHGQAGGTPRRVHRADPAGPQR